MKNRFALVGILIISFTAAPAAWGQWSSDPFVNLPLADKLNNDQVQPKVKSLPNDQWYVSWFDYDPNASGYSVYLQRLDSKGVEQFAHDGLLVAALTNTSTEDYGLDFDTQGNALLAFLDTREGRNQQVTAAKIDSAGTALWGPNGVQLTTNNNPHYAPKITGTSDGGAVVAWTNNTTVMVQKLDRQGHKVWGRPLTFSESGYNYNLADLHAADNGSVIVSWERDNGFTSNHQLRANKISAQGTLLWGNSNVVLFDSGSLQFGEFPYFIYDGNGGAVFSWYTSSPTLQVFAQHIRADGSEAFPHNGSAGSTNTLNVHVEPSLSYRAASDETFLFWTEEDSNQFTNGVSGQKFDGTGMPLWSSTGLVIVPLGSDTQTFVENVQIGTGALVFWVDSPSYGEDTMQATRLDGTGKIICAQFPVSTAPASKYGLSDKIARSGMAAVAWADNRIGNNSIYIQNVNPSCTLGTTP